MMPAVKHLDPIVGVDIHLIITPPGPVVPIPHPHIGMVFDPFDYIPMIGSTVNVNGLPRAQAGTGGVELPPHFPIGGAFAKPPSNENETFMGSSTVAVDGDAFTHMTLQVLSCQDIGMPSPPRKRGPAAKTLLLPTSIVLSIPAGPPVRVGGPPTISLMGMIQQPALGALLKGLKKLRKLGKIGRKMKALSKRLRRAADKVMDVLKVGPRLRNRVRKALCTVTGHPVDVVTGRVMTDMVDWALPGPIPLHFARHYSSSWGNRDSSLGFGWSHSLDLAVWEEEGRVVYRAEDGRELEFDTQSFPRQRIPVGAEVFEPMDRLTLRRLGELRWEVQSSEGYTHELRWVSTGPCRVVRTRSRLGHLIHYEYDARGQLEWVTDSAGRRLRFEHDAQGRLVRTWLPHPTQPGLVPHTRYVYSPSGDLVEVHDALGHRTRYAYEDHLLMKETDRAGLSFYFEYDGKAPDAWCTHTWGDGGIYDHQLSYNKELGITQVTDSLGHTTTYFSDSRGVVIAEEDPLGGEWVYEYDEALRKLTEIDPLGHVTRYEYDLRGNRTKTIFPDGTETLTSYDAHNLPAEVVDARGQTWKYSHDANGCLVGLTDPLCATVHQQYRKGLLVAISMPERARLEFTYDDNGNVQSVREGGVLKARCEYDRRGLLRRLWDAAGGEWVLTRDALGQVIQIKNPEGWIVKQRFDEEGHLVEVSELQRLLRIRRANFHKPVEWEENGTVIRLKYDTEGRLTGVQNESGELYSYVLDACGRVVEQVDFDGSVCRYSYDAAGRITRKELGSGRFSIFTHDPSGRVLELRHSDGTFARFTYEPTGEVRTAENESGTVAFERDPLGRVTRSFMGEEYWVSSGYSAAGARTDMQTSSGGQARMTIDALGRVVGMQCGQGPTPWWMALQYDARGGELGRQLPGKLSVEWSYDRAGRPLKRRTHGIAGTQTRAYRWGSNDKLEAIVEAALGTTRYTYDGRGHIVSQVSPKGEVQYRTLGAAANTQPTSSQPVSHAGPGGRLTEREGTRYVYDADGHLIEKRTAQGQVWTYSWNGTGTLREVRGPQGLRVRFSYDAFARRTGKQVFRQSEDGQERSESETTYVWDGHQLVHELTQGERPITWFWQPGAFTPSVQEDASGRYSVVTDHLGTPTELYAEDGRLAWKMQLDLFGATQVDTPLTSCQWRWPGQYEDPETGLYYNRFRYYDPSTGTYLSKDPLGLTAGLHRYAYVHDPLEWIDPLGLIELRQVSYHGSDNPFSQHMKNYLQGLDDASFKEIQSRNVALFQMKDGSIVPFVSESGAHSEAKGLAQLNHEDIAAVYSERKPCPSGKIKVGCEQKLETHLGKDVPVYWSYEHDGKGGAVDQLATKNVRNAKKKMRTGC